MQSEQTLKESRTTGALTVVHQRKRQGKKRRGVAAVEFAFAAPLLFLLVMAAIELGRMNMMLHTTNHAAYEAARVGIVPGADFEMIETRALHVLSTAGVTNAVITVEPTNIDEADQIMVTIVVPIAGNGWIAPHICTYENIQGSAELNRELTGLN